jgi:hypothetical protein
MRHDPSGRWHAKYESESCADDIRLWEGPALEDDDGDVSSDPTHSNITRWRRMMLVVLHVLNAWLAASTAALNSASVVSGT